MKVEDEVHAPVKPVQIQADQRKAAGSPVGLSFDELGGFEFRTDVVLYPPISGEVGPDVDHAKILLEDGSYLLMEDGGFIFMESDTQ